MKKLFKNYTLTIEKSDIKVLSNFCRQLSSQMHSEERFYKEAKTIDSFAVKLKTGDEIIKITKDEKRLLTLHLKENVKVIENKMKKSWFFKKWLYRTMYNQYNNLIINYFSD